MFETTHLVFQMYHAVDSSKGSVQISRFSVAKVQSKQSIEMWLQLQVGFTQIKYIWVLYIYICTLYPEKSLRPPHLDHLKDLVVHVAIPVETPRSELVSLKSPDGWTMADR